MISVTGLLIMLGRSLSFWSPNFDKSYSLEEQPAPAPASERKTRKKKGRQHKYSGEEEHIYNKIERYHIAIEVLESHKALYEDDMQQFEHVNRIIRDLNLAKKMLKRGVL